MNLRQFIYDAVHNAITEPHNFKFYILIGIGVIIFICVFAIFTIVCEYIIVKLIKKYRSYEFTKTHIDNYYLPLHKCKIPLESFKPLTVKEILISSSRKKE